MSVKKKYLKTWVEIDKSAAEHNLKTFRNVVKRRSKLMAVVKSNAYGHGLFAFSKMIDRSGVDGFCVDSFTEGAHHRREGIKKPILVLNYTFPELFSAAKKENIILSISSREGLERLKKLSPAKRPDFHLKIDTGMNRQGFYAETVSAVAEFIARNKLPMKGLFTHFSSAKNVENTAYTKKQFTGFIEAEKKLRSAGLDGFTHHVAATGGTLISADYHLDLVRLGIGLYGLWPSKELERQLGSKISLKPILSWRAVVGEVKEAGKGSFVGYDMVERLNRKTLLAVIPVGYWHGFFRSLSGIGYVIIQGRKARILGRVSMDIIVVDATGIPVKSGDVVTILGRDGAEEIKAFETAEKAGTTHYEFLTRINPLIERRII